MRSSSEKPISVSQPHPHYKPIAPASLLRGHSSSPSSPSSALPSIPLSSLPPPLTPDPSPAMNPQDPGSRLMSTSTSTRSAPSPATGPRDMLLHSMAPSTPSAVSSNPSPRLYPERSRQSSIISLPPLSFAGHPTSAPLPSSSSSSTRALHTLYPNATPPMSPAHALLSPSTHSTDPSHHSTTGFYQLPPPLQAFRPHDTVHQSPILSPQSSHNHGSSHSNGHGQSQGTLPPLPRSTPTLSYSQSPRSHPQQHSPLLNPHTTLTSSPSIGPLSPYPTPQHKPQHPSSPHGSPRYDMKHHSSMPSAVILPASAHFSSSFQPMSLPRPQLPPPSPYGPTPTNGSSTAASVASPVGPGPYASGSGPKSPPEFATPLKSPSSTRQRSAPNSPRRFMMLPPQTAPQTASGSSTGRALSKASTASSSPSTTTTPSTGKRRSSSNAKALDQETRDMMRKVSHSAIERRRRERINDKILQLKHLVPACADEDHLHKLSILQSTIEYIQYLKSSLPETVANVKFNRATNNNPNNKTTDMLDALNAGQGANTSFAPMMTTGLGHPYSKRIKLDTALCQSMSSNTSSTASTTMASRAPSMSPVSRPVAPLSPTAHDPRRFSLAQSSSDEDAKEGLLMLSQYSSRVHSANPSPNLVPEAAPKDDLEHDSMYSHDGYEHEHEYEHEYEHEQENEAQESRTESRKSRTKTTTKRQPKPKQLRSKQQGVRHESARKSLSSSSNSSGPLRIRKRKNSIVQDEAEEMEDDGGREEMEEIDDIENTEDGREEEEEEEGGGEEEEEDFGPSDDLEDEDYRDELEEEQQRQRAREETRRRSSSKMSVDQMLC